MRGIRARIFSKIRRIAISGNEGAEGQALLPDPTRQIPNLFDLVHRATDRRRHGPAARQGAACVAGQLMALSRPLANGLQRLLSQLGNATFSLSEFRALKDQRYEGSGDRQVEPLWRAVPDVDPPHGVRKARAGGLGGQSAAVWKA